MAAEDLDRSILWKKAREDSNGNLTEEVQSVANVIVSILTCYCSGFHN